MKRQSLARKKNWLAIHYYFVIKYGNNEDNILLLNNYVKEIIGISGVVDKEFYHPANAKTFSKNNLYLHNYKEFHEQLLVSLRHYKWKNTKGLIDDLSKRLKQPKAEIEQRLVKYETHKKILVTGTMSAGKSSLINVLIGKKMLITKNESATGKKYMIFEKAIDNYAQHRDEKGNMQSISNEHQLLTFLAQEKSEVLQLYTKMNHRNDNLPWCIIDTPGVNSSVDKNHLDITREVILEGEFDVMIYVINSNHLGATDNLNHLKFVKNNVPSEKIIFVMNKIDEFKKGTDSISASVKRVKQELENEGFTRPIVQPISAYTAYLTKRNHVSCELDEEEADELYSLQRKFNREAYDLSSYNSIEVQSDYEKKLLQCGFYQLEQLVVEHTSARLYTVQTSVESETRHRNNTERTKYKKLSSKKTRLNKIKNKERKKYRKEDNKAMAEIFLKYNPYQLKTTITIDGEAIAENSALQKDGKRLQEWIDELPQLLVDECNENQFNLTFMGTKIDLEDIEQVGKEAQEQGITINVKHRPVKEIKNMKAEIQTLFKEITEGPIEALKSPAIQSAFNQAVNNEFDITVVATMSSGKSTLINALLQRKLMPSSQEACTATITRIKDNDSGTFTAKATTVDGRIVEEFNDLQLKDMESLNNNEDVSEIMVEGDIPFTSTEQMSLVLIDTPGPNNSRDESHLAATYRNLERTSKTLVLYVLNATQLGVNDDADLLDHIADSLKVGGKQSKDRYLFVVNKLDTFRKGDDNVEETLTKVRKYLENRGIKNPNLFPVSALGALDIRTLLNEPNDIDEDTEDEIQMTVKKLNRNEQLHLENYATVTPSISRKITKQLEAVADDDKENPHTALIHSGLPSLEEMIKLYVEKYATTAKAKTLVETFQSNVESLQAFEQAKADIAHNKSKKSEIQKEIEMVQMKLKSGKAKELLKHKVNTLDIIPKILEEIEMLEVQQEKKISEFLTGQAHQEVEEDEANKYLIELNNFARKTLSILQIKSEELINKELGVTANHLLQEYKVKMSSLLEDMNIEELKFEPFDLVKADVNLVKNKEAFIRKSSLMRKVRVGQEEYDNPEREGFFGWIKFWEPSTLKRDVFKNKRKVPTSKIADNFVTLIQQETNKFLKQVQDITATKQSELKANYMAEFENIDNVLSAKLQELKRYTQDESLIEKDIKQAEANLVWLENMTKKINDIIEIKGV